MKKIVNVLFITACVLVLAFFGLRMWTKSHSPIEKLEANKDKLKVNVEYCRPSAKGRKIFGELIPFGTVWRTGANEATIIKFSKTCTFGGRRVKAGSYSLWTIPSKDDYWTVIINTETGQWGTNYDEKSDFLRFKAKAERTSSLTEQLTIKLNQLPDVINFNLAWENTQLIVPIR